MTDFDFFIQLQEDLDETNPNAALIRSIKEMLKDIRSGKIISYAVAYENKHGGSSWFSNANVGARPATLLGELVVMMNALSNITTAPNEDDCEDED